MSHQVAFATSAADRCIAGSPARQRGNFGETFGFLLLRQKKVTKEEAPNRTPAPQGFTAHGNNRSASGTTRTASLSLLSLSPAPLIAPPARLTRGCTPCSPETPRQRCSGDAISAFNQLGRRPSDAAFADEPGVQPALSGVKVRSLALVKGTAARAQRFASMRKAFGCSRAPLLAASRSRAVGRLFFGDFLLAQQKKTEGFAKVTPLPGGTPGNAPSQQALHKAPQSLTPSQSE